MTRAQTWKEIRRNPQADIDPTAQYLREKAQPTKRESELKSDSSNPTSAQPPSLLPPMLHQLIFRQGDSNQDAIAVHVHFTLKAGTILNTGSKTAKRAGETARKCCRCCSMLSMSTNSLGHLRITA